MRTSRVRPPAVAGSFYPGDPARLRSDLQHLLAAADPPPIDDPRAVIVPHAGYAYSGPVAASAYVAIGRMVPVPQRIVLVGPSHFVGFRGVATPAVEGFSTPMGDIEVDADLAAVAEGCPDVIASQVVHSTEHSLEVQLPFLQLSAPAGRVLPLLCGDDDPSTARRVIDRLLDHDPSILVIISSDLSHYLPQADAQMIDARTAAAIVGLHGGALGPGTACGRIPVIAVIRVAQRRGWACRLLDLRTSADTAGDPDRVVGYGAFVLGPSVRG